MVIFHSYVNVYQRVMYNPIVYNCTRLIQSYHRILEKTILFAVAPCCTRRVVHWWVLAVLATGLDLVGFLQLATSVHQLRKWLGPSFQDNVVPDIGHSSGKKNSNKHIKQKTTKTTYFLDFHKNRPLYSLCLWHLGPRSARYLWHSERRAQKIHVRNVDLDKTWYPLVN